ncbi:MULTISPECIES: SMC-Scp complex subunit ScpB [Heyndrickxia]|uniref:Segregation and condensation protein B n=1 Tax=Heyndrickxia oleronia TaxID=38875 RepID=A0A8E2I8T0_9BACI|nr:SMC-Scp complex subunit ScpB [Heyndrickxia oleronia]NYV66046.1 SMC-Scp complex subunit ScpB [Bacillus sp. Gen3]MBU5213702.1 SMC-Scp complex subunit ScpB [Heyndrickxia oleronia]MCI1591483.1 SMC-Scp complex subunit ScpB [Heyndrickxia oleronia]MCI1612234.1 SMC-Scp complex subunit ScpB [Heyndrickxia oleronia]MCI1745700.1 SMC-Scp complex subunit ScpB [Heyndrickxia oleronia]
MEITNLKGILESLLFAAGDEGLSIKQIMSVMELEEYQAVELVESLKQEYDSNAERGIAIVVLAGTYQLVTKKENSVFLKRLVESPGMNTLSQAALETLAIISYKQPITRIEIEDIRGVKTERPLQTLTAKGLIKEVGRANGAGRAILYGTTKEFLDYFGLKDINELPPLAEASIDDFEQEDADLFFEKFQETIENN